jgi:hypothetical protein
VVLVQRAGTGTVHIGSINGSENSSKNNRELALQITSNAAFQYYRDVFEYDWTRGFVGSCFPTPTSTPTPPGNLTATPTATPSPGATATTVVISEFRTRGPNGGNDEFIEIYNPTLSPIDISGWKVNGSNSGGTVVTRFTISAGVTLPAHGHFLAINDATSGYSGSVPGNITYDLSIADDGGIALFDFNNNMVDQVGMSLGSLYGEGNRLTPLTTDVDRGYERLPGGGLGNGQDTGNNLADFQIRQPSDPQNLSSPPVPPLFTPTVTPTGTRTAAPTSTFTATRTATATATATATTSASILVGHVTWQGAPAQPNARQQQPITLTLKLGGTEVNYPAQNTDSSGFFTVTVGSLPNGNYNWRVKGPRFLANVGEVALSGSAQTNAEFGLMRAGDANDNNIVNALDFNMLRTAFGTANDLRTDFNNDGITNASDFNLLRGNFGLGGPGPIGPWKDEG